MSNPIITEGPHIWNIDVWWGEDWFDAVPQMINPVSGDPVDVTNVTFELYARPSFNHTTRFILMSSNVTSGVDGEIIKDDPTHGLISFFMLRADVEANLDLSIGSSPWKQFLRATFTDPDLGVLHKLIWIGSLLVHPARIAATI